MINLTHQAFQYLAGGSYVEFHTKGIFDMELEI